MHIRLFGPAMLFATEGFESFNALIRLASSHSNRQAPSRDIGRSFARVNRLRHLLSGGYFYSPTLPPTSSTSSSSPHPFSDTPGDWVRVGPLARQLALPIRGCDIVSAFIANSSTEVSTPGLCRINPQSCQRATPFSSLPFHQHFIRFLHRYYINPPGSTLPSTVTTCQSLIAQDSASCKIGSFILYRNPDMPDALPGIGRLHAIYQLDETQDAFHGMAFCVYVQVFTVCGASKYRLPRIQASGSGTLVRASVSFILIITPLLLI